MVGFPETRTMPCPVLTTASMGHLLLFGCLRSEMLCPTSLLPLLLSFITRKRGNSSLSLVSSHMKYTVNTRGQKVSLDIIHKKHACCTITLGHSHSPIKLKGSVGLHNCDRVTNVIQLTTGLNTCYIYSLTGSCS